MSWKQDQTRWKQKHFFHNNNPFTYTQLVFTAGGEGGGGGLQKAVMAKTIMQNKYKTSRGQRDWPVKQIGGGTSEIISCLTMKASGVRGATA